MNYYTHCPQPDTRPNTRVTKEGVCLVCDYFAHRNKEMASVYKIEQAPLKYINLFFEWLGVIPRALLFLLDQHRNPLFWSQFEPGECTFTRWSGQQELCEDSGIKK